MSSRFQASGRGHGGVRMAGYGEDRENQWQEVSSYLNWRSHRGQTESHRFQEGSNTGTGKDKPWDSAQYSQSGAGGGRSEMKRRIPRGDSPTVGLPRAKGKVPRWTVPSQMRGQQTWLGVVLLGAICEGPLDSCTQTPLWLLHK